MSFENEEEIWRKLEEQFGVRRIEGVRLLLSGRKRIRAVSETLLEKTHIENPLAMGIYFATIMPDGIRLSIEGSQMVGAEAKKNIVEVDDSLADKWLKGETIPVNPSLKGYVIVKNRGDFLGCGKAAGGTLRNFVPKSRRLKQQPHP
ncbi:MAG: methyltransferase RsmF C-terminal domain-like protein [Candidatus Freyarchaeota archaeon]|nr:hypothetical protein [Candidatus Freyrarchaeum guaymaensis]